MNRENSTYKSKLCQKLLFLQTNLTMSSEKREHLYKILVIGELGDFPYFYFKKNVTSKKKLIQVLAKLPSSNVTSINFLVRIIGQR